MLKLFFCTGCIDGNDCKDVKGFDFYLKSDGASGNCYVYGYVETGHSPPPVLDCSEGYQALVEAYYAGVSYSPYNYSWIYVNTGWSGDRFYVETEHTKWIHGIAEDIEYIWTETIYIVSENCECVIDEVIATEPVQI